MFRHLVLTPQPRECIDCSTRSDSTKGAGNPPFLHCSGARTFVLMECPFGHLLVLFYGEGHSGRACCRPGFLDRASAIWLSWSVASSPHLFRLSWSALNKAGYWSPKQLSQTAFLERPPKLNSSSLEGREEKIFFHPSRYY